MWRQSRILPGEDDTGIGTGRKKPFLGTQDASEGLAEASCMQFHHHSLGNPSQPVSEMRLAVTPHTQAGHAEMLPRPVDSLVISGIFSGDSLQGLWDAHPRANNPQASILRKPRGWVSALPCLQLAFPIPCSAHLSSALEHLDSAKPGGRSPAKEDHGTHLKDEGDGKLDGGGEKEARRSGAALGLEEQLWMEKTPPIRNPGKDDLTLQLLSFFLLL